MNRGGKLCSILALFLLLNLSCGRGRDPYPSGVLELGMPLHPVIYLTRWEQSGALVHGTGKDSYENPVVFDGELYPDGRLRKFNFQMGQDRFAKGEFRYVKGVKVGEVTVFNEVGPTSFEIAQSFDHREDGLVEEKFYRKGVPVMYILRSSNWINDLQHYVRKSHHLERLQAAKSEQHKEVKYLNVNVKLPIAIPPDTVHSFEIHYRDQVMDCGWFHNLNQPNLCIETELPIGPHTFRYRVAQDDEAANEEEWEIIDFEVPVGGGVVKVEVDPADPPK